MPEIGPQQPLPGSPARGAAAPAAQTVRHPVEFTGSAAEYFRVWIVNVALTIVTLGIYSAWAKVRNKQYFYGNTRLAGGSFEYTADPVNILKGRLLVLGVFVAYNVATAFAPVAAVILALLLVPLLPWVVITSVRFNLRYSAYRGLRFHFDGGYWEAFRIYVLLTLAVVASFGLAHPYAAWRRRRFLVERARYGRSPFAFGGEVGFFYVVYIIAGIAGIGAGLAAVVLFGAAMAAIAVVTGANADAMGGAADPGALAKVIAFAIFAGMYLLYFVVFVGITAGVQAMIANHVWQRTRIGAVSFDLRLNLWRMVWIRLSNIVAIVCSLGLLIPWARVRTARYWLSRFSMSTPPGELERFVAAERERVEATGAEFGDALDLDLGL